MVEAMKKVAKLDVELTVEERNLLSVAYKNVIGARRASWRIISSIEQKEESKGTDDKLEMIRTYRSQVEKELRDICSDILDVLDKHLIPAASTGESKVCSNAHDARLSILIVLMKFLRHTRVVQ